MSNMGIGGGLASAFESGACSGNNHVYPKIYAGSPEYAAEFFSRCKCGKKRKVTTVTEVDVAHATRLPTVSTATKAMPTDTLTSS